MSVLDWDKLRVFHAVAEAGSFTRAGEKLNLSQSAISRQINTLEASLQTALFYRHARGLKLTEQGEVLMRTAHDVFEKLALAQARLTDAQQKANGPLKVTTTVAFGATWLVPRLRHFCDLHPDVDLSILTNDSEVDLSMREADLAIRMMEPRQPNLIQRQLMPVQSCLFAAVDYIRQHGIPHTLEDLRNHQLIIYGHDTKPPVDHINWILTLAEVEADTRPVTLRVNSQYAIYRAIKAGLGIGAIPDYMVQRPSNLIRILDHIPGPVTNAYLVYPEELRHSKRIGVFRDFLLDQIRQNSKL